MKTISLLGAVMWYTLKWAQRELQSVMPQYFVNYKRILTPEKKNDIVALRVGFEGRGALFSTQRDVVWFSFQLMSSRSIMIYY